jgi:Protein of unknown function (DUF3768)
MTTKPERIRALNDVLRCYAIGGERVVTAGIMEFHPDTIATVINAVAKFDDFTADNDPYGEHDCAVLDVLGERIMFKIDYYDLSKTGHSPDPSDPTVTARVMTIMLASEY